MPMFDSPFSRLCFKFILELGHDLIILTLSLRIINAILKLVTTNLSDGTHSVELKFLDWCYIYIYD
jgi:hypothetical protein